MRANHNSGNTRRTMTLTWKGLVATAVCLMTHMTPTLAQCPEAWVPGQGLPGTGGTVFALTALPDGDVIVGGDFTTDRGAPGNSIARFHSRTGTWSAVGGGMNRQSSVLALTTLPDGDVIAGGSFITAGGVSVGKIARYRTATDTWEAIGAAGAVNRVATMTLHPSGDLIIGGLFTSVGGIEASNIARYNPRTGAWSALGGGVSGSVVATAVLPDGDVIAAGYLTAAGGIVAMGIARYNPATELWSAMGGGTFGSVAAVAFLPSGSLIVGGLFSNVAGVEAFNLASYDPVADAWSTFPGGVSGVSGGVGVLTAVPGGKLIVGSGPIGSGGPDATRLAMFDPATGRWTSFANGLDHIARALAILPSGDLMIGGSFSTVGGVASWRLARCRFGTEAPRISIQPVSQIVECPNVSATFTVTLDSDRLYTYQWRKNGFPIYRSDTPSATTASLVLDRVSIWDEGSYDCIITNGCGSVTSTPATLSVFACPCPLADIAGGGGDGRLPDGTVDGTDFIAFMNSYALGDIAVDPLADIYGGAEGGTDPNGVIDDYDFFMFTFSFASGC